MDAHLLKPLPLREVLAIGAQAERNLLPGRLHADNRAKVLLLAIGLQESRFQHRRQIQGPAVSFWQQEKGGGIRGTLGHEATWRFAGAACMLAGVNPTKDEVYKALQTDDVLGWAFARMLLFTDPKPLPALGDQQGAWDAYERTWRPGKPHRSTWNALYAQALEAVMV